jgi:hypothetical protein
MLLFTLDSINSLSKGLYRDQQRRRVNLKYNAPFHENYEKGISGIYLKYLGPFGVKALIFEVTYQDLNRTKFKTLCLSLFK